MGPPNKSNTPAIPASGRIDWSDLRVFLQVAESGSLSAAAKALQMSQPTVSQNIKNLETSLNTQLFVRGASGVELTTAGVQLRERALPMQRAAASIESLSREGDDALEGRVKVAAPDGILSFWIAPRIAAFQRMYPGIKFSFDAGLWPDNPLMNELDISVQYEQPAGNDRVVEPLATVHYAPVATRRYLEIYGEPKTHAEMASHRWVHHAALKQQQDTWDKRAEAALRLSPYNVETNSSAVIAMALMANAGLAYLPTFVTAMFKDFVMIGRTAAASPMLYLVYDPRVARVARCEVVLRWIRQMFSADANPWFQSEFVHPDDFGGARPGGILSFDVLD